MHSTKRLNDIRKLPCVICNKSPIEVVHCKFNAQKKAHDRKLSDEFAIPLCRQHRIEFVQFQKMNRSQSIEWFNQMLEKTERMLYL